jgi:hypothetical protein
MQPDIPAEQLERIRPVLGKLQEHLRVVLSDLPEGSECAIQYSPLEEE